MPFYPDVKSRLSPSALAAWHNQKSSFIKSYFEGIKSPETTAMKLGKEFHALVEGGFLKAQKVYNMHESAISYYHPEIPMELYGIPDSHENNISDDRPEVVEFVDYKTGKADDWKKKLPSDLKMKMTAWLVWQENNKPETVRGFIEYFRTEWNPELHQLLPCDETSILYMHEYSAKELEEFTDFIKKTTEEVNTEYELWLKSSHDFIKNEDVDEFARINEKILQLQAEQEEVKSRIAGQMEFGGIRTHETPYGSFYFTERKSYKYPEDLAVKYLDYGLTLKDVEDIGAATSAAKKGFEQSNQPASVTKSLGFRTKKKK